MGDFLEVRSAAIGLVSRDRLDPIECRREHRQVGIEIDQDMVDDLRQRRHQRRTRADVGVRIGAQIGDPVDQAAHRMLATRKKAAVEQRRLHRHHLQAKQLLLDRIRDSAVGVDVVEDDRYDLDGHLIERRAVLANPRQDLGMHCRQLARVELAGLLQARQRCQQWRLHRRQRQIRDAEHRGIRQHPRGMGASCGLARRDLRHRLLQHGHLIVARHLPQRPP